MFAGHIRVLGGPHVARKPYVAQAWYRVFIIEDKTIIDIWGVGINAVWLFCLYDRVYAIESIRSSLYDRLDFYLKSTNVLFDSQMSCWLQFSSNFWFSDKSTLFCKIT